MRLALWLHQSISCPRRQCDSKTKREIRGSKTIADRNATAEVKVSIRRKRMQVSQVILTYRKRVHAPNLLPPFGRNLSGCESSINHLPLPLCVIKKIKNKPQRNGRNPYTCHLDINFTRSQGNVIRKPRDGLGPKTICQLRWNCWGSYLISSLTGSRRRERIKKYRKQLVSGKSNSAPPGPRPQWASEAAVIRRTSRESAAERGRWWDTSQRARGSTM